MNEDPKETMLREFQAEIQHLRMQLQLQAANGGSGGSSSVMPLLAEPKAEGKAVERVVEKLVGLSEAEARALEAKAAREARREADAALAAQSKEAAVREQQLRERLSKEAEERAELQARLQELEAKLIRGGDEKEEGPAGGGGDGGQQQQQQRRRLAQNLAIQEEANLALEEQYSSLQEEVEAKTRKLRRLWARHQAQQREAREAQEEFRREREEVLETVRQLTRQVKLKDLILSNFVPPDDAARLEARACWREELDAWTLPRLELAGNNLLLLTPGSRLARPTTAGPSTSTCMSTKRPETRYARARRPYDTDPRFRGDNLLEPDLEPAPEGTTQHYQGRATKVSSGVARVLDMPLDGRGEGMEEAVPSSPSPYLRYAAVLRAAGAGAGGQPPLQQQQQGGGRQSVIVGVEIGQHEENEDEEEFPTARGLVR